MCLPGSRMLRMVQICLAADEWRGWRGNLMSVLPIRDRVPGGRRRGLSPAAKTSSIGSQVRHRRFD